jgi:hypothetical protein
MVRTNWQAGFGLGLLAAGFAGWASPCQTTAAEQRVESIDDTRAKAQATYRRGDHDTTLQLLRDMARHGSAFTQEYRKAVRQGLAAAHGILGVIYENGIGVPHDPAEAVRWFRKAAEQGDPRGQDFAAGGVQMAVATGAESDGPINNSPQESAAATPGTTPIIPGRDWAGFPGWDWDRGTALEVQGASSPSIPAYTWLEIKSLGLSLLRPAGWFYKEVEKNGTISAFITKENIAEKGRFQTGLTIHGIPTKDMDPVTAARGYVYLLKSKAETLSDAVEMKVAGRSFVRVMIRDKQHPIQMAIQAIGDPQSKRVVIMNFEAPADSWANAWKQGEPLMGLIRFARGELDIIGVRR